MRCAGVDPSSSCTGFSVAEGGQLLHVDIWKPPDKGNAATKLYSYFKWVGVKLALWKPDMVAVETIAVGKSHQVTRVLSRYEAATMLQARRLGIVVLEYRVSEARKEVFEKGNLAKEDCYKLMKKMHPEIEYLAARAGGMDQTDAATGALAAPLLAER